VTDTYSPPPTQAAPYPPPYAEDEIDLVDLWRVIWQRRKLIVSLCVIVVVATAVISLFMKNIYQTKAVIVPVTGKESGTSGTLAMLASQFGGLPGMVTPGAASAAEIVALLKSNILREEMVKRYNLLPVLFEEKWDPVRKTWKKGGMSLNPLTYLSRAINPPPKGAAKEPGVPDMWDALRLLDKIIQINNNVKDNTITITVDFPDPEMAKQITEYLLSTLTDHMSNEAKRVALTNRKYLEEQLTTTSDPLIKQNIYNLIAQQIQSAMMAEVKENFAFKVIDPPKAPDKKSKPKRSVMVTVAFVTSLFLGIFLAFFLNYIENVKSRLHQPEKTIKQI